MHHAIISVALCLTQGSENMSNDIASHVVLMRQNPCESILCELCHRDASYHEYERIENE